MRFDSRTTKPSRTLLRTFTSLCRPHLRTGVGKTGADAYVKRYHSIGFAIAWVGLYLFGLPSLSALQVHLSVPGLLRKCVGWGSISRAHINRLHHDRPPELWAPLISHLMQRLQAKAVPSHIRLLDTSFFTLSTRLLKRRYPGKRMRPGTAGVKLGAVLDPSNWIPTFVPCRVGQDCDTGWLDELVPPDQDVAGIFYIFDRGFRKYAFYERLMATGADFLTRASAQIHYRVTGEIPLDPGHPEIVADQRVILGSVNGHNLMKRQVRRIQTSKTVRRNRKRSAEQLIFLTSDLDSPAHELCELYRRRWEIETFFRWFKRTIGCDRPFGYSAEAAAHSFSAALVTYLLVLLTHQGLSGSRNKKTATSRSAVGLARTLQLIRALLHEPPPPGMLAALQTL